MRLRVCAADDKNTVAWPMLAVIARSRWVQGGDRQANATLHRIAVVRLR